jgi:hypothetical protein
MSKLLIFFFFVLFYHTQAYDPLDPNGNITIKWDIIKWTWARREIIWDMLGG